MILTEEDDEFARIERENKMRYGQPYHFEKREWVGLTEEDKESFWTGDQMSPKEWDELYAAVEAKLKEKNT